MPFHKLASKPLPGARINWGHPLTQDLVFALALNEREGRGMVDAVSGEVGTYSQDSAGRWRERGFAFDAVNGVTQFSGFFSKIAGYTFSVVCRIKPIAYASQGSIFSMVGSSHLVMLRMTSATTVLWSNFFDDLTVTVPSLTDKYTTLGGVQQWDLSQRLYYDGYLAGSRQSTKSLPVTGTGNFIVGGDTSATTQNHYSLIEYVYVYRRALTPEDNMALHANPYDIFLAPAARRYFVPVTTVFSGTSNVTAPAATLTSSGTVVNAYTGTSAVTAAAATVAATGTVVNPSGFGSNFQLLGIG